MYMYMCVCVCSTFLEAFPCPTYKWLAVSAREAWATAHRGKGASESFRRRKVSSCIVYELTKIKVTAFSIDCHLHTDSLSLSHSPEIPR